MTFGPIPGSPSIDKTLKIEQWARRDVLSTLCPLNVRSCVAGACTYLQQIPVLANCLAFRGEALGSQGDQHPVDRGRDSVERVG